MDKKKKPELLIPAKGLEELKVAVTFGADAVYIGGEAFGLRAGAKNFSPDEMREGIAFAHDRSVKVYVTANILAHNDDIKKAVVYFKELEELSPDAIIISDPGLFDIAREVCPDIDIHISTQANNTNFMTYLFWGKQGAKRIVSARELSLKEISGIRKNIPEDLEIETFVHGAMCISYSGRCLLSNYFTGRDANKGACAHPCRWQYAVAEVTREGQYLPIEENDRGTFIFNSKDLCMVEYIPELVEAGIDSFKVEGRMKNSLYIAAVTRAYRKAIDDYFEDPGLYSQNRDQYRAEAGRCTTRPFSTGFFFGKPDEGAQIYDSNTYTYSYTLLGVINEILDSGEVVIYQKNKFSVNDEIEIIHPDHTSDITTVREIRDENGEKMESAPHPQQKLILKLDARSGLYDVLRMKNG
ncbi:MAG: U32 family peptidase [Lachnospiraceae bacterium]|nr:U32 family peptidase [Lachnospiraceae bacterium]